MALYTPPSLPHTPYHHNMQDSLRPLPIELVHWSQWRPTKHELPLTPPHSAVPHRRVAQPAVHAHTTLPPISQPSSFLRAMTDDASNPNCPIKIAHGTTTLAFRFKGGIIVCTDSRATAGSWIASQTVKKVIEINPMLLGTMAGGAAVGSDVTLKRQPY